MSLTRRTSHIGRPRLEQCSEQFETPLRFSVCQRLTIHSSRQMRPREASGDRKALEVSTNNHYSAYEKSHQLITSPNYGEFLKKMEASACQ